MHHVRYILPALGAAAALCLPATTGTARLLHNPDANTLWIEDGEAIEVGGADASLRWNTNLGVAPAAGGGFVVGSRGDKQDCVQRYLLTDPAYPYLTWEIAAVVRGEGYQGFVMAWPESVFDMVSHLQTGIFAVAVRPDKPNPMLGIYLYNSKITLKYLKLVKRPEYYIELSSPALKEKGRLDLGDALDFRVVMAQPAEDVTLTFFHSYVMPQLRLNGEQKLQLKPADGNRNVWRGSLKVTSCEGHNLKRGEQFAPGKFLIKATILGGGLNVPLWTANAHEFHFNQGE
jgi:hypothetical protein